jgi:HEAT repeat protein
MGATGILRVALASSSLGVGALLCGADPPETTPGGLDPALLARAPLVVVARVAWVRPGIGGAQSVVRLDVERTLRGTLPDRALTLFLGGPSRDADPRLRGRLDGEVGRRSAFFLSPSPNGSGWVLEALFSAEGEEGAEKASVLERELALEAVRDDVERRRKQVSAYLDLLARGKAWGRLHASRQLRSLAEAGPQGFEESARAEVEAALARAGDPRLRSALEAVLARVGEGRPSRALGAAAGRTGEVEMLRRHVREAEGDEARVVALTALARRAGAEALEDLLAAARDPSRATRERAVVLLGDLRRPEALPPLLEAFPAEEDPAVREATVRAVGLAGGPDAVPWLAERSKEDATRRASLYALARIGTRASVEALAAARQAALEATPPDRPLAGLVDYLRGPGFREAERAAGRPMRETPPEDGAPASPGSPDGR